MMYDDLTIAVIGDIMLDHWREGTEYKLNPESPTIDIVNPMSEYTLGGAGNVARIVRGLGAKVYLVGVLGSLSDYGSIGTLSDLANDRFADLCIKQDIGNFVAFEDRKTTIKERIVCAGQQICRITKEDTGWISASTASKLVDGIVRHSPVEGCMAKDLDGIIIADYSKGVMRDQLIYPVMRIAKKYNIPVLVDPQDRLYIYKGCTIMKPNRKEWRKLNENGVSVNGFFDRTNVEHLVVTNEDFIAWWSRGGLSAQKVDSHPVEVANVSGAGDAVAAVLLMEYIRNGGDIKGAVELANWGASRVVQQERTGHLTIPDLMPFLDRCNRLDGAGIATSKPSHLSEAEKLAGFDGK